MDKEIRYGEFVGPQNEEERKAQTDSRTRKFIISTNAKDRHGTVLNPKKWNLKNYKKNPIVAYQHDVYGGFFTAPDPDKIIGKGKVYLEGDKLMGDVEFEPTEINEFAEKILNKVDFGTLRATSVGFYPEGKGKYGKDKEAEGEENETFYYAGQELLEFSIVNIGSNPETVKRATPEVKEVLFKDFITNLISGKMTWEEIERLTVKGVFNIFKGIKPDKSILDESDDLELTKIKFEHNIKTKNYDY